ncbi:hypothetical protein [Sphingosinicella sp. BN140058]|uniref:hypothetical protein n=1 Tax=Sphingosinicella sp. BN140058 TaxID=1892855 RepID=UPI001013B272|nr:hypothetical protein [Sphingosinicella sp. BN140058]QAY75322.1 hypothetical protein ETR14_01335 [Sphingosinicella sp. BN140058]
MNGAVLFAILAAAVPEGSAVAREPDHNRLFRDVRRGALVPLSDIEKALLPQMRNCQYLGPEYDPSGGIYRLKFLCAGQVLWIDVDARTGRVVRRTSP